MKNDKKDTFFTKFFYLLMLGVLYVAILTFLLYIFFTYSSGLVLLYTPVLIFTSSLIGPIFWQLKYHKSFEAFLVYATYTCFGFAFIFLAPLAVERSLSTFIFFYTAENDSFPQKAFSTTYMKNFFEKRIDDGLKGNFLTKEGNVYKPTLRTKIYYNLLYPLGLATNMLQNYKEFTIEVNSNKKQNISLPSKE